MGAKRHLSGTSQEATYIQHTHTHTDGYRDSMTELAQRADSVKKLIIPKEVTDCNNLKS